MQPTPDLPAVSTSALSQPLTSPTTLPTLTPIQLIREAATTTKLREADLQQFSSIWNELTLLLSIRIKESEVQAHREHLKLLTGYIKTEYPALTIGDIKAAYRLGVKCKLPGKNGEPLEMFAELNPRSIGKVLDAYETFKRDELSRNPIKVEPKALLAEPVPSQQQQDRANAQLLRFAYQCKEQGRDYVDHGNLLYDWLDSKGLIPFERERKWSFMHIAQEQLRRENAGHGATGNLQEHKDARNVAALLKQAIEQKQVYLPMQDRIRDKAKQVAFIQLLTDMIEFDQTVDELLEPINLQANDQKEHADDQAASIE